MSNKITKADLQSDMFLTLSDRILDKVVEYQVIIASVLIVILIGGLGYVGFESFQNWRENKAALALYPLNRQFADKNLEIEKRKVEANKAPADKKAAAIKAPVKVDFQAEYGKLSEEMRNAIRANASSQAAMVSAVDLAKVMLDQNQPQMAIDLLKPLTTTSNSVMQALLRSQLGAAYSYVGQYPEAVAQYEAITKNKELSYMHPEAYIKQAVCYEKMGQADKARGILQKVSLDYPQTQAAQTARLYARVLSGSETK